MRVVFLLVLSCFIMFYRVFGLMVCAGGERILLRRVMRIKNDGTTAGKYIWRRGNDLI